MKKFLFLIFAAAFSLAAEQRVMPLESDIANGCFMQSGVLKAHKTLPSQKGRGVINISPASAVSLFFQEDVFARRGGAKENELIQIKKSALEYTPQKESDGTSYIDYCRKANYQFNVETPGVYDVYFRVRCPSKANWTFIFLFEGGKYPVHLQQLIPAANVWFWAKGPQVSLEKRNYQFTIDSLLNGKRLGAIAFVPKGAKAPAGILPYAENRTISSASMVFKNARPAGVRAFDKVLFDRVGKGGNIALFASVDNGKSFKKIINGNVRNFPVTEHGLVVRVEFFKDSRGVMPGAENIRLRYDYDPKALAVLENNDGKLYFSRRNGSLSGIELKGNKHFFQTVGIEKNMFELLLKQPGKKEKRYLSQTQAKLERVRSDKKGVVIDWSFPREKIKVSFNIRAQKRTFEWDVIVDNKNPRWDVIEVEAPRLHELHTPAHAEEETLIWPFSAGEFLSSPALKGGQSVTYPDHAGLPFMILTGKNSGFYFGLHDKFLITTHINSRANGGQNAVELSFNRVHRIKNGEKRTYSFVLAPFTGTWHEGAKIYREFFYKNYPLNTYRPWLRNADLWVQGSSAGHTGAVRGYASYREMIRDFKSAAFLSSSYIQAWGCNMNGACPTYYLPRLDKGGEKLFARMIKSWRDKGGYIGHYYFGNGMAWFYSLSDYYFGIPWSKYPADVQPPKWDWFVKNKEYISDVIDINKEELLPKVAKINEIQKAGKFVSGGYGESYIPMNWRNGEFAAWLLKWIDRYVSQYHCNTAYLDTFVFRNDHGDFNPFLKLNGEGDKPVFKFAFMNDMFKKMRAKEPDFCALTEGIADVFGTKLYFLISGFARNPAIFRYTIPDQIIFQGSCNGLWSRPLSEKSITEAFLLGNRFDWVVFFDSIYYILKLRQRVSPFLNYAVFDDVNGISCTVKNARIYAHKADRDSQRFIDSGKSKYTVLTMENPDMVSGKVTYDAGFKVKYAMLCEYLKEPVKMKFVQKNGVVTFDMPQSKLAAVILVDELHGKHAWTAVAEQTDWNEIEVRLTSFLPEKRTLTVRALGEKRVVTLNGFENKTLAFKRLPEKEDFAVERVEISSPDYSDVKIISIGDSGRKVPVFTTKRTKASDVTKFDFEEVVYSKKSPFRGERAFELQGNGRFCMKGIPLKLEPETLYQLELQFKKGKKVSPDGNKCFLMIANYTRGKKLERYLIFGGNVIADGNYHTIKSEFKTSAALHDCRLFVYNHNSQDSVFLDDVEITKYMSLKKVKKTVPAKKTVIPATADKTTVYQNGFESPEYKGTPYSGKGAYLLEGNGKYKQFRIGLKLKKNQRYRIRFAICKDFDCSTVGHKTMACVGNYTKERKLERYLMLAGNIRPDGRYHLAAGEFRTSDKLYDCALYFYNRDSHGKICIDDIIIEEVR